MKVFISNPHGRDKLIKAFEDAGAEIVHRYEELTDDVKLIVPTVDEEIPFFSRAKNWFRSKGIEVAVSPEHAIRMCRDKMEFYRFCRRHEFGVIWTMQEKCLVKPRFGKGSRGQFKVDTSYIVQEFVEWPEYSIDYVADFDGNTVSVIPRKRLNVINGESHAAEFVNDKILIDEATRLGNELGLCGHNVMQCFYDGQRIKWIEVNLRYGGGSWMTFPLFNSPKFFVDLLSKTNVSMPQVSPTQAENQSNKARPND